MAETTAQFEARKQDHLRIALSEQVQAVGLSGLDQITLLHEALPEINLSEVDLRSDLFGHPVSVPYFISSMTAGHADGLQVNLALAKGAAARNWPMAVGSQRRELTDPNASREWSHIRKEVPGLVLLGNIGLSQLIQTSITDIQKLVDSLGAVAFFVHSNPLQEALQPEGTPDFRGGLKALTNLCKELSVPVVFKETGCGLSKPTLERLAETGVSAVDVAGLGGTHWGRVEGQRADQSAEGQLYYKTSETFANWGLSTVQSVVWAKEIGAPYQVWASGGVRSGLDAAKLLALGAVKVGLAQPLLQSAMESAQALEQKMQQLEYELKVAMFCTGWKSLKQQPSDQVWTWTRK